jgi:hypothetical protein
MTDNARFLTRYGKGPDGKPRAVGNGSRAVLERSGGVLTAQHARAAVQLVMPARHRAADRGTIGRRFAVGSR